MSSRVTILAGLDYSELASTVVQETIPPCALCVDARVTSAGEVVWCKDHAARKGQGRASYDSGIARWIRQSAEA